MLAALRRVHRWFGLFLALPLLLQGLSGLLLAVRPWLAELATIEATTGEPSSPAAIVAAAQAEAPTGLRPVRYVPPMSPGQPALVTLIAPAGARGSALEVWIDPVSLVVLDQQPAALSAFEWVKALHTNLLIEGRAGRSVIGWFGVGLIVLAMIGIPLWWPPRTRWRDALTLDASARGRAFHRRLHGATGVWSVLLLLAMATTGVVTAFPQTARGALGLSVTMSRPISLADGALAPAEIDRAVAAAQAAAPGLLLRAVLLPASRAVLIRALLIPPGAEGVSATVTAAIDAATGRVVSLQDPRTMPVAELALRWAHDLHFGQGLGPLWRLLTALAGLVLPIFGITGTAMWWYRQRRPAPMLQPGE